MDWKDTGLVLAVRKHGETSAIVELMTEGHGRHLGLVRGGRSSRMRPILQPGNSVFADWRARLEEHLGTYHIEADELRAARLMQQPLGMYGLQVIGAHLRLLPERETAVGLYRAALVLLDHLDEPEKAARLLIRFELAILEELGFGLDLNTCAATGSSEELVWVSPRSGRAVSRDAGKPYETKLLPLPAFLTAAPGSNLTEDAAIEAGFDLTGYFLDRHVYGVRGIKPPEERAGFIRKVLKALQEG